MTLGSSKLIGREEKISKKNKLSKRRVIQNTKMFGSTYCKKQQQPPPPPPKKKKKKNPGPNSLINKFTFVSELLGKHGVIGAVIFSIEYAMLLETIIIWNLQFWC